MSRVAAGRLWLLLVQILYDLSHFLKILICSKTLPGPGCLNIQTPLSRCAAQLLQVLVLAPLWQSPLNNARCVHKWPQSIPVKLLLPSSASLSAMNNNVQPIKGNSGGGYFSVKWNSAESKVSVIQTQIRFIQDLCTKDQHNEAKQSRSVLSSFRFKLILLG